MNIRLLTEQDTLSFHSLRLRGLQEAPDAFGMTAEEFVQASPAQIAAWIRVEGNPPERFVLGAFDRQDDLIGMVGFFRENRSKSRHKGSIWGMYVAPEARGQGIGRLLLQDLLRHSAMISGLEQLHLSVVTTNEAARRLYVASGFRAYGLEPRALKQGEHYLDEEYMVLSLLP